MLVRSFQRHARLETPLGAQEREQGVDDAAGPCSIGAPRASRLSAVLALEPTDDTAEHRLQALQRLDVVLVGEHPRVGAFLAVPQRDAQRNKRALALDEPGGPCD